MAIGIYFRTAYERIKTNFRNKKYDPMDIYYQIRSDMFPKAEWSKINPKDIVLGCLKLIGEDFTDIEFLNIQKEHKFHISRSSHLCEIITRDVYIKIQNYNTYDYCTMQYCLSSIETGNSYSEIDIVALIVDTICNVLAYAYREYYFGRSKYNL